MDFQPTVQQDLLRKVVRQFADDEIAPLVNEMEITDNTPLDLVRKMGEQGFMGVTIPAEYGGTGMGHLARMIMIEEVGRISAGMAMALQVMQMGAGMVIDVGSDAQKAKYSPLLAQGKILVAPAITESSGGSDLEGLSTRAVDEGANYSLTGRKVFITNSHISELAVIIAKNEGGAKRDFSAFLIENGTEGFRRGRVERKIGFHGCITGELIMEDCRIPKENLFGDKGRGLAIALKGINDYGRMGMVGIALGLMQASLEASVKFAQERVLYGKPISNLAPIQFKIAEIYADLEASRFLAYNAAWLIDQNKKSDTQVSSAKFFSTEAALQCTRKAMDIYGAYGCMKDYPLERYCRDAQLLVPADGTNDVMRVIAGRNLSMKK